MTVEWQLQDGYDDCWICAVMNALRFQGDAITKKEIMDIIASHQLEICGEAGFFTYIPLILQSKKIACTLYLPISDAAVREIVKGRLIDGRLLKEKIVSLYEAHDAMYMFYRALEIGIQNGVEIQVQMEPVDIISRVRDGHVVIAGVSADRFYRLPDDPSKHVVTLIPNQGTYTVIDSLQNSIESALSRAAQQYDWENADDFFVILESYCAKGLGHDLARNLLVKKEENACNNQKAGL